MTEVSLRTFDPERYSQLLQDWLRQPHVIRWWGDSLTPVESIQWRSPETHAIIEADGTPVGYLCWQKPLPHELEAAGLTDLPDDLMDIDILIGEPDYLGMEIGPRALAILIERFRADPEIAFAGLGMSRSNTRAIRAYEKAGFTFFREFEEPETGPARYMILDVRQGES